MHALEFRLEQSAIRGEIKRLEKRIGMLRLQVVIPPKNELRPATPADVRVGAVFYHEHGDDGWFWNIVEEVNRPNDAFKAYMADDGCLYGIEDAFVDE